MLYVYHNTSKDNAENIRKTGVMSAKEDGIFVSTKPDGQSEFDISSDIRYNEIKGKSFLLIDDNSSLNITQMLAKYISVLTNCDVCDSSSNKLKTTDLMNVSTATYVYDNDVLKKSDKSTLTFNSKTG